MDSQLNEERPGVAGTETGTGPDRYRALVTSAADIHWTAEASGEVVEDSPSWRAFTGQTLEQWKGFGWLDAVHPDDRDRVSASWRRAVDTRSPLKHQCRMRHVSGDWHLTEVRAVPVLDADGAVREWVGMNVDITERGRAEEALRRSEANLRDFLENASVAIHWVGPDGLILWANQTELDMLGYTREEYICHHIAEFHADQPVIDDILERLTRGETLRDCEARLRHKDGSIRHVLISSNVLFESGEFVHTRCFTRDITQRKEAEDRLRLVTDELAHRSKNLLSVVHVLVSRSLAGDRPLAEARDVLQQRLHALARSQSAMLSPFGGARLAEIIGLQFEAFSDQLAANGPDVMLNARATQTFALLVHELATNATKHGALSRPTGQVAVDWHVEGAGADARFKFRWREHGGPAVTKPDHLGFGRMMLESGVAQDFGTQPMARFEPDGLIYEIDAPLSAICDS